MAATLRRRLALLTAFGASALIGAPLAVAGSKPSYLNRPSEQTPLHLGGGKGAHQAAQSGSGISGMEIGRVVFALLVVIAVALAVRWVLQKLNPKSLKGFRQSEGIELRASKSLPSGSSLHVIQIGDRAILVGAGTAGVSKISDLAEEDMAYIDAVERVSRRPARKRLKGGFGSALSDALSSPSRLEEARREARTAGAKGLLDRLRDRTAR